MPISSLESYCSMLAGRRRFAARRLPDILYASVEVTRYDACIGAAVDRPAAAPLPDQDRERR